jgi:hypothetical protein
MERELDFLLIKADVQALFFCFGNSTTANRHNSDNEEATADFVTHQQRLLGP